MSLPLQSAIRSVLLRVLTDLGGRARPRDIYPMVTQSFPEIVPADLVSMLQDGRTNRWQNRIQWARQDLVQAGLIDASERGLWGLTERGRELAVPGVRPEDLLRPRSAEPSVGEETKAPTDVAVLPLAVSVIRTRPESIASELAAAASDSGAPTRLEHAAAEAFAYLGFETETIGGPGQTDVLLTATLGLKRYSVVVDAKSTGRGRVADSQISWLSIRSHRDDQRADYACVVGPDFARGDLQARANEFRVCLLTTEELQQVVSMHAVSPFTLTELRAVFESVPLGRLALPNLRAASADRQRRMALPWRLLDQIDTFNRMQPNLVLAKPDTLFASVLARGDDALLGTTLEDVRKALLLLETIGVLSPVNGGGYTSETSTDGARQVLAAFVANASRPDLQAIQRPRGSGRDNTGTSRAAASPDRPLELRSGDTES